MVFPVSYLHHLSPSIAFLQALLRAERFAQCCIGESENLVILPLLEGFVDKVNSEDVVVGKSEQVS